MLEGRRERSVRCRVGRRCRRAVRIELELSSIVVAVKQRRERMSKFDVFVVTARIARRVSAIFADVELMPTDLVAELVMEPVHFTLMRFETAALSERLLAQFALERTNTYEERDSIEWRASLNGETNPCAFACAV